MPSRNVIKQLSAHSFYHVYNRGVAKQAIFIDTADRDHFLQIIARHLDPESTVVKTDGLPYRKFHDELELLCYCLMGNHFHLLFYQVDNPKAMSEFMRAVLTAYTMYYNRKYQRVGPLFQSTYKASLISSEGYLSHISRYIHLNPVNYRSYAYSSLRFYLGSASPAWLRPQRILDQFDNDYLEFLEEYEERHSVLKDIQNELAHA